MMLMRRLRRRFCSFGRKAWECGGMIWVKMSEWPIMRRDNRLNKECNITTRMQIQISWWNVKKKSQNKKWRKTIRTSQMSRPKYLFLIQNKRNNKSDTIFVWMSQFTERIVFVTLLEMISLLIQFFVISYVLFFALKK